MNLQVLLSSLFAGFLISVSVSVMLEVPRHLILKNGLIGFIAELIYVPALIYFNVPISVFIACLVVTLISHYFARKFKAPVTVFCIPVFFIFVPGTAIYQLAYSIIQSNQAGTIKAFFEAVNIAGAVALGVFVSDTLVHVFMSIKYKRFNKKALEND